jgi:hypothetical protein
VDGGQGALFEKTAPWTVKHPQKLFIKPEGFTRQGVKSSWFSYIPLQCFLSDNKNRT